MTVKHLIIYHSPLNFKGGAEKVLELFMKRLSEKRVNYIVLTSTPVNSFNYINMMYKKEQVINLFTPRGITKFIKMKNVIDNSVFVITQPGKIKYLIPLSPFIRNLPKIIRMPDEWFGIFLSKRNFYRLLLWKLQYRKPILIAISEEMKNFLEETWRKYRIRELKIHYVIPPPYDEDFFYFRDDIRDENTILMVNRIHRDKRVHLGLKAYRVLRKMRPRIKLYIVGYVQDFDYYQQLLDYIRRHGLSGKVKFITRVSLDTIRYYYWKSSILWNFSRGFGGVVNVEALACGCLPITTLGSKSIVAPYGKTAYSLNDYIENTLSMLECENIRRLAENAAKYAKRELSSRVFTEKILNIAYQLSSCNEKVISYIS